MFWIPFKLENVYKKAHLIKDFFNVPVFSNYVCRCLCNDLIAADYVCDASCLAVAPSVTAELQSDGTLQVKITNSSGHVTTSQVHPGQSFYFNV